MWSYAAKTSSCRWNCACPTGRPSRIAERFFRLGVFVRARVKIAILLLATLLGAPRAWVLNRCTAADVPLDLQEEEAFRQAVRRLAPSLVRIQTVGGVDRVGNMLAATAATTG